jgi:protein-tyrosine-phosphatase
VRERWLVSALGRRTLARRARRALERAGSVAFICYGNICRSPFAAEYARQLWSDAIRVSSAGVGVDGGTQGRRSPPAALEVGREHGVELAVHAAQPLSDSLVAASDVLLVFDRENLRDVLQRFPAARDKTYWVGALRPAGPLFISDPFGQSADRFRQVYAEIVAAVEAGPAKRRAQGEH